MKFEAFFNFHIKWLSFLGFRFKFGNYKLPKRLSGDFQFWFCTFLQVFVFAFNCYYLKIAPTLETLILGTCNLIYVVEACLKSQHIHYNTGKIDSFLYDLKSLYDATECHRKYLNSKTKWYLSVRISYRYIQDVFQDHHVLHKVLLLQRICGCNFASLSHHWFSNHFWRFKHSTYGCKIGAVLITRI